jgi:predicted nucleotidyltransferase
VSAAADPTAQLRALARRVTDAYLAAVEPRAALLVGSAASGDADGYSDLDLIVYHELVPEDARLAEIASGLRAAAYRAIPWSDGSGAPDERGLGERYLLGGVECQLAHVSVGAFEREIEKVVVELDLSEELLKIMSGLHEGLALHGRELVGEWRRKATYTDELQRATVEKRWKLFPWWYFQERLRSRDATAWRHEVLAQSVYAIVGSLAALNRLYFSTFEFKRARRFVDRLEIAPPDLAARLDKLFELDERRSTNALERLVAETQELLARHLPELDFSLEWGGKRTDPGDRERSWS